METAQFKVFRFDPTVDKKFRFDTFKVELREGMTVLEGLFYIQENLDGSLAFRSSCRAGVCGSCAMHINGRYRLACETQIAHLKSSSVKIRPLAHLPVFKDLFVDMENFWRKYKEIKPYLIPGDPPPERERVQSQDERARIDFIIDCILCAACYAGCPVNLYDEEYLGPTTLLKANRFFQDSRDSAKVERLELVDGLHGVWRCHTIYNCQEVCPKEIDPTASIANLKRHLIGQKLRISVFRRL